MATYQSIPPEIRREIASHLELPTFAQFAGAERGLKPTLEQCCFEPSATELFRLLQAWRNNEIRIAQRMVRGPIVLERDNGDIIEIDPIFSTQGEWSIAVFNRKGPMPASITTEDIRELLHSSRLYFPNGDNIKYFMWVLRNRISCVKDVPGFIQRCLYNWLFLRTEESKQRDFYINIARDWLDVYRALNVLLPRDLKVMDYWSFVAEQYNERLEKGGNPENLIKEMTLDMLELTEPEDYNVFTYHLL